MADFTGRVQVICIECLDMDKIGYEESKRWPRWTDADYERHAERIEERYG